MSCLRHAFTWTLSVLFTLLSFALKAQTNPTPQSIPYTQDFGNNWFLLSGLPQGYAVWTSASWPNTTLTSAANSSPISDDSGFDSATVVKTPGQTYGYSGISWNGTPINNGQIYVQTSDIASGSDQMILALNTTGYASLVISFDVEMINPQPKLSGFVLQFRVGTAGSFTTIDSSYWHNSIDRIQNQVDYFVNMPLPASADNQPVVQIRWATAREMFPIQGGSCGFGFDNIVATGTKYPNPLYFRTASSGNWNSITTWESSPDNITWIPASYVPNSTDNSIMIRSPHKVSTTGIGSIVLDELIIDAGSTLVNSYGTIMGINDGPGSVDLDINGTFIDSSNYSVVWANTSRWRISTGATLVKTTNTSSTNWQLKYYNGISSIPSGSNWVCRKPNGAAVEPSVSTTNGGPPYPQAYYGNLYIENNSSSWNTANLCKFSGNANFPIIKGNLYIGGNGSGTVNFTNSNTHLSPIKVMGDLVIKSGSTITVTGTGMEIIGNLSCNGNYTNAFSASKILFSGANNQLVSGIGTINTYGLELNKTSGNVTLNDNINVFGNLNMTSGIVSTSASSKIIVQDNGTTSNASDISYVDGPVQKKGDDPFTFPVGKNSNYQPVSINAGANALISDAFTAEYFQVNPQNIYGNNLGPGLDHISKCEYWTLSMDIGNSQKNVTLTWDGNSCGVTNLSSLRVARFNSSMWINEGNLFTTGSATAGTISSNVTSGFGPFTLASINSTNPLPITLLSFTAKYNGKEVKLSWVTATEVNCENFTIERSRDGKTFESILKQNGAGTTSILTAYSAEDINPLMNISYYRLKQSDFDGRYVYSDVIPVKIKLASMEIISLKTSKENASIDLDVNFPYSSKGVITISDLSGKAIRTSNISSQAQVKHFSIDTENMASGVYYLRLLYGDELEERTFIY